MVDPRTPARSRHAPAGRSWAGARACARRARRTCRCSTGGGRTSTSWRWSVNDLARPDVGFSVVDRHDDRLVGHVTLFGGSWRTRSAELAVMLGPDHRGRGLGTDAVRALLGYAFAELGLHRVSLKVWAYDDRALAAYRRVGFVEEGRPREVAWHGGGWHDEVLMAVLDHEGRAARP